jgi:hypothetical protein
VSPAEIVILAESSNVSLACIDGEVLLFGTVPDGLHAEVTANRQDLAIHLMAVRGDYDGEPCAHELRVLKALQGCITTDLTALEGVQQARIACELAHQALADVQRLATTYRWLSKPESAAKPDYYERLQWAGHAALRLVGAASELAAILRPAARQEALL